MTKRKMFLTLSLVLMAGLALALFSTGYGTLVSATTTSALFKGGQTWTANSVSVINLDSNNYVFVAVDCTTNQFNALVATTNAIPIPPTMSYTFDANGQDSIHSLCYATTNGTADIVVATY